jgi:hypothetical protein
MPYPQQCFYDRQFGTQPIAFLLESLSNVLKVCLVVPEVKGITQWRYFQWELDGTYSINRLVIMDYMCSLHRVKQLHMSL